MHPLARSLPSSRPEPGETRWKAERRRYVARRPFRNNWHLSGSDVSTVGIGTCTGMVSQTGVGPDGSPARQERHSVRSKAKPKAAAQSGMEYAPGIVGKHLFRVRESYVAGPVAQMIRSRRYGAVKLDLVMRGLALPPESSGNWEPGTVLRHRGRVSYEALHDLCRNPRRYTTDAPQDEIENAAVREQKRNWVREQLKELEQHLLVRRVENRLGQRPELVVLSDRGDGTPFDDPTGETAKDESYVSILGPVLAMPEFRDWRAHDVVGFLCAMTADRFGRHQSPVRDGVEVEVGCATWFRQADWFNNENPNFDRPEGHVPYPFSTSTIERGLRSLRDRGLIVATSTGINPVTGQRFQSGVRLVYENRFGMVSQAEVVELPKVQAAAPSTRLRLVQ